MFQEVKRCRKNVPRSKNRVVQCHVMYVHCRLVCVINSVDLLLYALSEMTTSVALAAEAAVKTEK